MRSSLLALLVCVTVQVLAQVDGTLRNPIVPGDHPDPTIIRVGDTYWTASTAGNWAPEFSLYQSTDLLHWTAAGAVFPHAPTWATSDFWAPELVHDGNRVLVYYVGRKRGGPLCVAVGTASSPEGPYQDRGPIMCQEDGSIDPAFARDERGQPYLIWKEDGNSRNLPTQIWAQPLTADLLQVTGQKTELLVNDPKSWEGGVVEAPYILRHSGLFYLFYAGNACCGLACHYAEGVARAEHLLGPWTKDPKNPIIAANGAWRCPGHGTAVESPAGKDYFVYHAYPASGTVYLGRQSVIDSMSWSDDGWPVVNQGRGPGSPDEAVGHTSIKDDFVLSTLSAEWKWPVGHEPEYTVGGGKLTLTVPPQDGRHSFIARSLLTPEYAVSVSVLPGGSAAESLVLIGDAWAGVGLSRREQTLELWQASRTERKILWSQPLSDKGPVTLRVTSTRQGEASFSYRILGGPWMPAGDTVELKSLLPWDSGLRMGLMVDGAPESSGSFAHFEATGADE